MTYTDGKCEVCGAFGPVSVLCSFMGNISQSYCDKCRDQLREPWVTLVGGLAGSTKESIVDEIRPIIKATCEFYNKTEDELWAEIATLEKEFAAYWADKNNQYEEMTDDDF